MNDKQWEDKLRRFVERTGQELKRVGEDVKQEAERLLSEMKDPERQRKVREGIKELGSWAKDTAEDVANLVEEGLRKAERAWKPPVPPSSKQASPPASPPPEPPPEPSAKPKPKAKSIGGAKKKASPAKPKAKKPLGKKTP